MPISRFHAKGSFKVDSQTSVQAVRARSQGIISDAQWEKLQANIPNTATMEKALFLDNGYKPVSEAKGSGLGDTEIGLKWNFLNLRDKLLLATKTGFRVPTTTHTPDETNILDQSTGDKQLDYALQVVAEYIPVKQFSVAGAVQGTYQFQDTQKNKAVLRKGEAGLPNLHDGDLRSDVKRDLGEMVEANLGAGYGFIGNTLTPSFDYSYYYKAADKYSGPKDYLNYSALGDNTESMAHRGEFIMKYSTIPLFAAKKFPVPFEVKTSYQRTFAGKNIVDRNYYRFDMIVYF
jgi:hypothetical protein